MSYLHDSTMICYGNEAGFLLRFEKAQSYRVNTRIDKVPQGHNSTADAETLHCIRALLSDEAGARTGFIRNGTSASRSLV